MPGYINFKELAEAVDVEQVALHHTIGLKRANKELRAACPACNGADQRSLCLYPETNSFRCFQASISGDSIALHAHLNGTGMYAAAKSLGELFGIATASRNSSPTAPQKPEGRTEKSQPPPALAKGFDADKFAEKLTYDGEVKDLSPTKAKLWRIGMQRGKLYLPICPPDVKPTVFAQIDEQGNVKLPDDWLPDVSNVVTLKRA
jgi:hypothetical protein